MNKAESTFHLCRQSRPVGKTRLKQNVSADDVGADIFSRAGDRAVNVACYREMQHAFGGEFLEKFVQYLPITNVGSYEPLGRPHAERTQRIEIGGVGQLVDVENIPAFVHHEVTTDGRADEADAARDEDTHQSVPRKWLT
jgi:hypothetical protein